MLNEYIGKWKSVLNTAIGTWKGFLIWPNNHFNGVSIRGPKIKDKKANNKVKKNKETQTSPS